MPPLLTVVICTRNPPLDRLACIIEGLRRQTLPLQSWSLCIIDNGSFPPLEDQLNLDWHPGATVVVESCPGLTPARLKGIRSSSGHLVFVDDDNVLDPDYLENAAGHLENNPTVGAFGGSIELEFETSPPEWVAPFRGMLAERRIEKDLLSYQHAGNNAIPCGAGMIVRREVADAYLAMIESDSRRLAMDRKESSLISDGDTDLALTACDLGLACGQFPDLKLTHLIPASRLTVEYFERLAHGMAFSGVILRSLRDKTRAEVRQPTVKERVRGFWQELWMLPEQRRIRRAWARGRDEALKEMEI